MLDRHFNDAVGDDGMGFGSIGANYYHKFGIVNVIVRIGRRTLTDGSSHPFETWSMTDTCAVIDMQ